MKDEDGLDWINDWDEWDEDDEYSKNDGKLIEFGYSKLPVAN